MAKDILITPGANDPKIDFTGSGVGAEATTLKVNSDSSLTFGDSGADFLHVGDNVGVGTANPSEKLHVVGNVLATGDVSATTISSPTITNLQASATDADNRLDTAETTISQIEGDINTLEASATDHESRIATLESAPGGTSDHGSLSGLADDDHTQYVIKSPSTTARNTIQPSDNIPGLTIQAGVSNTSGLLSITNSGTAEVFRVNYTGSVEIPREQYYAVRHLGTFTGLIGLNSANSRVFGDLVSNTGRRVIVGNDGSITFGSNNKSVIFANGALNTEVARVTGDGSWQDADNILHIKNSTSPQTLNLYNTYTNASNYERLKIGWDSNILKLETENAGTGSARDLGIYVSGSPKVYVKSNGYVGIDTTNPTSDLQIGTSTSVPPNRWLTITGYDNFGIKFISHGGWNNYQFISSINGKFLVKNIGTYNVYTNFEIYPNTSRTGTIGVNQSNYFVNNHAFLYFATNPSRNAAQFAVRGSSDACNLVIQTRYSNTSTDLRDFTFTNTGFFESSGIKALNSSFTNTFAGPIDCDLDITANSISVSALNATVTGHVASGSVHFTEASIDHGSIAGLGDDDHTQYVLATGARSMNSLSVTGNISVTGTVDGRDIAADGTKLDNHVASGSVHFTEASIDHGSIAGLGDNDHPQYVLSSTNNTLSSTVSNLQTSATEADKRSQVIWDHLLPHDQNGNWNGNTANGGNAYQQNQGGAGAWMYADTSVQGVMTVTNGNSTATNSGATKYHTNFSTYLNVDTIYYFRVATGHTTDVCIRFGVTNDSIAATATPQRGAYAQVDTSVDSNIYLVTADDNVRTETDTGLGVSSMNQAFRWFAIRVEDAGGGARAVGLYDVEGGGTLLAKNTTNIPDAASDSGMRAFIQCIGRGSTFRACYLDTFGVYMPGWVPPNWLH